MEASLTEPALRAWGERVGKHVDLPVVLALRGDLGAGKSTLARAVAQGAGVNGPVPSPTFNLRFSYDTPRGARVHHLDLYRLGHPEQVWELGWEDLGTGADLVLIEWPERAESLLAPDRWDVTLDEDSASTRHIRVRPVGNPPPLPPFT